MRKRAAKANGQRLPCGNGAGFDVLSSLSGMNTRFFSGMCIAALLLLGGCVTGNRVWPEGTLAPAEDQWGMARVWIESRPAGAQIAIDGRVVGHAPLAITVPVTRHGFFPDRLVITARFLAEDQSYGPLGVRAGFGPLDKVPAGVVFTPDTFWPR